ncbi:MAG: hypothetical protein MUF83_17165 [Acidimicrobiales bacterium]|nr:hypothetical protein [Acidimicrobiales bacterium]
MSLSYYPDVPHLDHHVVERDGPQRRLLLLIHGYGESPAMLTERLPLLDPDGEWLAVTPLAPFEHKNKAVWHRALSSGRDEAVAQFLASFRALHRLVDDVCEARGLRRGEAVVGGFSSGAGLAVAMGLAPLEHTRTAGCLAFCGFTPPIPLPVDLTPPLPPTLLLSARVDEFVPIGTSRASASVLDGIGVPLEYHELDGGHEITDEAARLAGAWLTGLAAGQVRRSAVPDPGEGEGLGALVLPLWGLPAPS